MDGSPNISLQGYEPERHVPRLAALELARRSTDGVIVHPTVLLIFSLVSTIGAENPWICFSVVAALFLFACARFALTKGFEARHAQKWGSDGRTVRRTNDDTRPDFQYFHRDSNVVLRIFC